MKNLYSFCLDNLKGKISFGRPKHGKHGKHGKVDTVKTCELYSSGSAQGPVACSY